MIIKADKNAVRQKRHYRIRKSISGTAERPRLNVYRSTKHIYAQIIDDNKSDTVCSASTLDKEVIAKIKDVSKRQAAYIVGQVIAQRALDKGIKEVVFDRGGYLYTGRVQQIAEGARAAGLKF
ncbi:MAG: 50S ribosomal protein L18 [Christensenellales bacterium]|jgi:large subunit ribosomal protein L18